VRGSTETRHARFDYTCTHFRPILTKNDQSLQVQEKRPRNRAFLA